ncbi:hypothetical protein FACS18948_3080 [Clostridia bacterium]|nr:hypothetical protein FACS18948_3080 [Clostridia bacterium]
MKQPRRNADHQTTTMVRTRPPLKIIDVIPEREQQKYSASQFAPIEGEPFGGTTTAFRMNAILEYTKRLREFVAVGAEPIEVVELCGLMEYELDLLRTSYIRDTNAAAFRERRGRLELGAPRTMRN